MEYVGQENLIKSLRETNSRSILIQGPTHFGKKTLIRDLYKEAGMYVYEVSGSVGDFRETIEFIKTQTSALMYLIPDVDRLHPGVQNLLLKILEEPPMRARFCLTASNTILPTIRSRCVCYSMQPYTPEQIVSTLSPELLVLFQNSSEYVKRSVASPGQLKLLYGCGGDVLLTLVEKITELSNALYQSPAKVLNLANELTKFMREKSVDMYTFCLLARGFYSDKQSYSILTRNVNELDRYLICYFYSELWKEVACS